MPCRRLGSQTEAALNYPVVITASATGVIGGKANTTGRVSMKLFTITRRVS